MKIVESDDFILISVEKSSFNELESLLPKIQTNHLLIEFSEDITNLENNITFFLKTALDLKAKDKSFVIIKNDISINDFPEILNIAPTLQEAIDILEMENIERDLGF